MTARPTPLSVPSLNPDLPTRRSQILITPPSRKSDLPSTNSTTLELQILAWQSGVAPIGSRNPGVANLAANPGVANPQIITALNPGVGDPA